MVAMSTSPTRSVIVMCAVAVVLGGTSRADAEPTADDKGLANLLFQEGRTLLLQGRIPEACKKLEESQRLDPAGGTLLNLALCHEREQQLARSWSEYNEAMLVARRDGRRDREVEAANHVRDLEPRLSRLTIVVPPETRVDGLRVERDGREVGPGAWSTAIPVDGGEHVVRATAPGREPFSVSMTLDPASDARTVAIPVLATPIVVVTAPRVTLSEQPPAPMTAATAAHLRWAGLATAGAGVVALGLGGWALSTALAKMDESSSDCTGDNCGTFGQGKRRDAVARGDLATILGVGGVVLVGAGATLYLFGRQPKPSNRERSFTARFSVGATSDVVMTGVEGRF